MNDLEKALDAANGYLTLGMPQDAWEVVEGMDAETKGTLAVIVVRVRIYQSMGCWDRAGILAGAIVKIQPEEPAWWILLAESLRYGGAVYRACEILGDAVRMHPGSATITYNLACYTCLTGDHENARILLEKAFALEPNLRKVALEDPDLDSIFGGL